MRLAERGRWPDVLYASVTPDAPVRALQADLATAFPSLPLYGGRYPFEPHVAVVEGSGGEDPQVLADASWGSLPVRCEAGAVELIIRWPAGWRVDERFPLRPRR